MQNSVTTLSACVVALLNALPAQAATVAEGPYGASLLTVLNSDNGWSSWGPGNFFYGAGTNAHGSSGNVWHTFNGSGDLTTVNIGINELRNLGAGPVANNNPLQKHYGQVQFTALDNVGWELTGAVRVFMTGLDGSSSDAIGSVVFEQVGGPTLYTFGAAYTRTGAVTDVVDLFNAASPQTGANTGTLTAGLTYKLSWSFEVSTIKGFDESAYVNIFDADGPSFMQIAFVPAPGTLALPLLAMAATRRRRG